MIIRIIQNLMITKVKTFSSIITKLVNLFSRKNRTTLLAMNTAVYPTSVPDNYNYNQFPPNYGNYGYVAQYQHQWQPQQQYHQQYQQTACYPSTKAIPTPTIPAAHSTPCPKHV
jgi:hypothetical protein